MIANFFKKSKPVNIFNLVVLLLAFYLVSLFFVGITEFSLMFLLKKGFLFIFLFLFLMIENFIVKKNNLTEGNSYTMLLSVLLIGAFYETMYSKTIIFSNILLLLGYRKIYSIKSGIDVGRKLFDAGLWIGAAALIYPPSLLFGVLIFLAVAIYQKLYIQNFIIPIFGLATPFLLFFTYSLYVENAELFYQLFQFQYSLDFTAYHQLKYLIPLTLVLTITTWSILAVTPKIVQISNTLRLSWNVLLAQLVIATVIIFFSPVKNGSEMLYLVFPCVVIITNFIQKSQSKNFKNLILYLFLMVAIGVYFL